MSKLYAKIIDYNNITYFIDLVSWLLGCLLYKTGDGVDPIQCCEILGSRMVYEIIITAMLL